MASDCRRKRTLGSWLLITGQIGLLVGCAAPMNQGQARAQSPLPSSIPASSTPLRPTALRDPGMVVQAAPTINNPTGEVMRLSKPAGASAVLPIAAEAAASPMAQAQVRLVAMVGNTPIYESEARESVNQRVSELLALDESERPKRETEIFREELKRIVERELIIDDMVTKLKKARPQLLEQIDIDSFKDADKRIASFRKQRNITNDAEFKAMLVGQGLSLEGMRRQMARAFVMNEYIRNLIGPRTQRINIAEIRDYYDEHPDEFFTADALVWQDIFLRWDKFPTPADARKMAGQIISRAKQGENFVTMGKQYDHGDSTFRNGLGIGEKRGEVRPSEVEPVLFALKNGEVGTPIEMEGGMHIVRVESRTFAGRKPFDMATQNDIRRKLSAKIAEVEYRRIIEDLKAKTTITYYPLEK